MGDTLSLTKHHGLGNDFLVVVDAAGPAAVDGAVARALCNRTEGVGADGLIVAGPGRSGAAASMTLWNADGSRAEMSGNGIRCLGQALVDGGVAAEGEVRVATDAGERVLTVGPEVAPGLREVTVAMGKAVVTAWADGPCERSAWVDTGNPHLVVLIDDVDDRARTDLLRTLGETHHDKNVELIRVTGPDRIDMTVWERGVGPTRACGTGSVAAAAAARSWQLTGDTVVVANPGGELRVELADGEARLTGPAQYIGRVEVPCR